MLSRLWVHKLNTVFAIAVALMVVTGSAGAEDVSSWDSLAPIEKAKALRDKVDNEEDPDAMYALAALIILEAPKSEAEYNASEWRKYGGVFVFGRHKLLQDAAELGNRDAAKYLCAVASDPGAPGMYRRKKDKWCSS